MGNNLITLTDDETDQKLLSMIPSAKLNQLAYMEQLETEIQSGKISIFSCSLFPYSYRPYQFTPDQLREALEEYADSPRSINKLLKDKGIDYKGFWDLVNRYEELRALYQAAFARKGKEYYNEAQQIYATESPPEWAKDLSESGKGAVSERWSAAAVQYIRNRADFKMRQAIIHDRDTFGEKQQIEVESKNLTININADAGMEAIQAAFSSNK